VDSMVLAGPESPTALGVRSCFGGSCLLRQRSLWSCVDVLLRANSTRSFFAALNLSEHPYTDLPCAHMCPAGVYWGSAACGAVLCRPLFPSSACAPAYASMRVLHVCAEAAGCREHGCTALLLPSHQHRSPCFVIRCTACVPMCPAGVC
jgi:hypothetical protein